MKTIAICNLKGGVAKTVSCVNIAAILAHDHDKRVLVIDADAQANATEFLGGNNTGKPTMADLLRRTDVSFEICQQSNQTNVDLIAADDFLMDLDLSAVKTKAADVSCLVTLCPAWAERYDFALIDCPPAFNAASAAALLAADEVMIPIKLDAFSLRGMSNLTRQISNMRQINPRLRVGGILPTMWYLSDAIVKAEETLRLHGLPLYPHIRRSAKVDDMTFAQKPLIVSSPKSGACQDYRRLCRMLVEGGVVHG